MKPQPPTCAQIADEELGSPVFTNDDTSWRHGFRRTEVYKRNDNTYWQCYYRVSTDGETNELREGCAIITQVEPYEERVTLYRPISTSAVG